MKILFLICFGGCLVYKETYCAPVEDSRHENQVVKYLERFGYLPKDENSVKISQKKFNHALRHLQRFANIPVTGEIDDNTIEVINRPRCGVPDVIRRGRHREKRYELLSDKWRQHKITWFFDHKKGRFQRDASKVRAVIDEALSIWAKNSVLTFEEAEGPNADILISFEKAYHPEVDPYQMANDVLAHAFGPGEEIGGDAHFRINIQWDFDSLYGDEPATGYVSFFAVALHELGHSLGLSHSDNSDAVMYFSYSRSTGTLADDDIQGIQHIYGVPEKHEPETTTWIMDNSWPVKPNECNTSYDAITLIKHETFIFKDNYYWRPDRSERDAMEIRRTWKELPENLTHVDAVFEKFGETFFFIGRNVYVFNDMKLSYTTTLAELGIEHHFSKVDAVFKWHYNKKTYILSGDQYWRWDGKQVDKHYPKDISRAFQDVYNYDTAFSDDEKLYFFKGVNFYEFDHITMRLNRMNALPSAQNFMKCNGSKTYVVITSRIGEIDDFIDITPAKVIVECNIEKNPEGCHDVTTEKPTSTPVPPGSATTQSILLPILLGSLAISQLFPTISLLF